MLTFTYLKKSKQFAVIGPVEEMKLGPVSVQRSDGAMKTERIIKLTRPFEVDGKMVRLGIIALLPRGGAH